MLFGISNKYMGHKAEIWVRFMLDNNVLKMFFSKHNIFGKSLVPGRCGSDIISKFFIGNSSLGTCSEIYLWWILQNIINWNSTLILVMAWWCQQLASAKPLAEPMLEYC